MKKITLSLICCTALFGVDFAFFKKNHQIINMPLNTEYTGKDTSLGIVDTIFSPNHPSIAGKQKGNIGADFSLRSSGSTDNINETYRHGTHVLSIAVGAKPNEADTPYGIAPDATYYGASRKESPNFSYWNTNLFDYFTKTGVKVVNYSIGFNDKSPITIGKKTYDEAIKYIWEAETFAENKDGNIKMIQEAVALSKKNILQVFGAGNFGDTAPNPYATLASYDEDIKAWLVVGALNSMAIEKNGDKTIIKDSYTNTLSGGEDRTIKMGGIYPFSNGFKGAINYALMAPGTFIESANVYYKSDMLTDPNETTQFYKMSGTSQATPMVSGAALLLQQKFPFLNGKQIADTLLSTANKNYELPAMIIKDKAVIYTDNKPDESTIRAKLQSLGYKTDKIEELLKNVIKMTREELMGQGILDVSKTLGGLAVLDANRLTLKDILTPYGTKEAYYKIDTNGADGEFSNDITQKKWDDSLHLSTASNSPAQQIKDLNVGFIKEGKGKLTFSGNNSYEGATIVRGGELNLKQGSKLTKSDVYVENGGILSGSGEISKNLTNKGIVQAGGENGIQNLNVSGKYTQEGANSALRLNFDTTGNSKLIASSYEIKGGKLQYKPLSGTNYAGQKEILIDLGNLKDQLDKFTKVEILSTNTTDFKLNVDKLHINKQDMEFLVEIKPDAFEVDDSNVGEALRKIAQKDDLSEKYNDYFAKFQDADNTTYDKMLSSISSESYLENSTDMISTQYKSIQNNMLFTLNPMNFTNILTANTPTQPVMLASLNDDTMTFKIINDSREPYKNTAFYLTPRFKKTNGDEYSAKGYGFDMGVASAIDESQILALSVNYSKNDSEFKYADFDSKYVNLGINHSIVLKDFKILSGFGLGYGKTDFSRNVVLSNDKLNGNYKNTFVSAQLGVAKDFTLKELTITPLTYLNYNLIRQNAFSESGGLFAREYEKINHNTTSISAGVNLNYTHKNENKVMQFGGYALYERRLSGKKFDNRVKFKDFNDSYFMQKYELDANLFTLGLNSQLDFSNGIFTRVGLINEFSSKRKSSSILATFGYKF
ncbi:S8 family serine peptidase [Campylobacter mucosalis]|uniref:S8 family serine peptidase n=1 Tax=Campylobacter mucosalis TaxID=202 RepID=UPI00146FF7CF|nr:S8 family serine peptidase [Campylobacter mucosalis]